MAITAVYHTTGYPGFVGTCKAWFPLVYKQKHKDINKMAEEASFFVHSSCAYKHKQKKNEHVHFSCAYAYCMLGVANGTLKNVSLGKFWQDLEISEVFLTSLGSLVFAWFVFPFFESRNFLAKSLGLGFLTRISASRVVSDFTIRHPLCCRYFHLLTQVLVLVLVLMH